MVDSIAEYMDYAWGVWRKRWIVLLCAIVICSIGWPIVQLLPDNYQVSAKMNVDTQSLLKPLLRGLAVDSDITQETALVLQRTLLTRPNLERVARATDLDLLAKTPTDLEGIIRKLARNISITTSSARAGRGVQSQNIYSISYQDTDPQRAKNVVDELLTLFIDLTLSTARKDTSLTQEFINKQIKEYETKLEQAETRLKEFKHKNVGLMPNDGRNYYSQLAESQSALNVARLELDEAKQKRDAIKLQINEVVTSLKSGGLGRTSSNPLDVRIETMRAKLDELLLQFTEQHPDVVSVRRILVELEKQKASDSTNRKHEDEIRLLENNPVYQDLKVALGEQEAQLAALTVRVGMYNNNVEDLKKLIDTIPRVEAELAKLNRDYTIIQENYSELVKRRESANISFEAGNNSEDIQFKIIDPPRVPLTPTGPNRLMLFTLVLLAGLGVGIGAIVLTMQLKPTFSDSKSLNKTMGLPVFGVVSMILSERDKVKTRVSGLAFGAAVFVVLAIYAALLATQLLDLNIPTTL